MEIAPGLHRIGDDRVAAYLVVTAGGATLIDAALPGYRRNLRAELDALGLGERDISGIVLTHGDVDHIGFAEALRSEYGIPVYVHEADADRARGVTAPPPTSTPRWKPWPAMRFIATALTHGGLHAQHLTDVVAVTDGEVLDLPGSPRIISVPGHSPGSIAVHLPSFNALAVGDALTTRHVLTGRQGPQPAPFTDDPDAARASLARLRSIEARWVLPGHGPVWGGGVGPLIGAVLAAEG